MLSSSLDAPRRARTAGANNRLIWLFWMLALLCLSTGVLASASDEAVEVMPARSKGEHSNEGGKLEVAEPGPGPEVAAQTQPAAGEAATDAVPAETQWRDEVRVVLTPGEGTEFKLTMDEGAIARYSWVSEGGSINFATHGDGSGQSISYEKGRGVPADEGELVAAFTGNHGWFFRNRNDRDITLVLRTGGDYGQLKKLK